MAASDQSLAMREGIIVTLRANAPLVALVPALRIYGEESPPNPVFPFIRYGWANTTPYESSCGAGSEHGISISCFAVGPGTDACARIMAAIVAALNDQPIAIDPLRLVGIDWLGSNIFRDTGEASIYHGVVRFTATTLEGA